MPKTFSARILLSNLAHDLTKMTNNNKSPKETYLFIKKKIEEIEKYSRSESYRVNWD